MLLGTAIDVLVVVDTCFTWFRPAEEPVGGGDTLPPLTSSLGRFAGGGDMVILNKFLDDVMPRLCVDTVRQHHMSEEVRAMIEVLEKRFDGFARDFKNRAKPRSHVHQAEMVKKSNRKKQIQQRVSLQELVL
jgi:hypothetical protein